VAFFVKAVTFSEAKRPFSTLCNQKTRPSGQDLEKTIKPLPPWLLFTE